MTVGAPSATPRARALRAGRALVWVFGCALHGVLLAVADGALRTALPVPAGVRATSAGVLVVFTLAWLVPEAAWWLWANHGEARSGAPRWRPLQLAHLLRRDGDARKAALRDAIGLHAILQAPALGVALALLLGGVAWALPVLGVLSAPWVARHLRVRATGALRNHAATLVGLDDAQQEPPRPTRRALRGVALTSTAMLGAMLVLVTQPAPARPDGACPPSTWATRVALPGPIAGTPLRASIADGALTLATEDGGGPGAVALARGPRLVRLGEPRWAWVEAHGGSVRVTLCAGGGAAAGEPSEGPTAGHVVVLAPEGYRLDDDVASRVLRGRASSWCALLVLLLLLALRAVGRPALLDAPSAADGRGWRARTTPALLLAMALSVTQLTWVGLVLLGH